MPTRDPVAVNRLLADDAATADFARCLYGKLPPDFSGWTILLRGELGAGKSTFARALINAAGHSGPVPSPTYTLLEPYKMPHGNIYHIDLYRVSSEEELSFLGWEELDDGLRLVEWPDRAPGLMTQADMVLTLTYENTGRRVELRALSERGKALVKGFESS
jgi:tRNA threonylcarbamoyladenosine biosynthesis protein TsaE